MNETEHESDDVGQYNKQPDNPEDIKKDESWPNLPQSGCARCGLLMNSPKYTIHIKKGWAEPDLYESDPEVADDTVIVVLCHNCFREAFEMAINGSTLVEEFNLAHFGSIPEEKGREVVTDHLTDLKDPDYTFDGKYNKSAALLQVLIEVKHGFLDASVLEGI